MTGRIEIIGLVVDTHIGVTAQERSRPQEVVVDIDISKDLSAAGATDSLDDTIDYDALVTEVAAFIRSSECNLLERLASQIADRVSAKQAVNGVTVRVKKLHVPVDEEVAAISVTIERGLHG
ncbi:MAG: dihydroneopterin aldolase / 2-amino-4-hydroxy-6-hydroxymethyldihydropteridine diphosphokinase [Actinomycetota bacterium]|nr:dihydroneopterin aldolase / 2-amino-4-hydroxy-6-hydroxymethyldihydropteridine diphosphokinase [Actinomycetota bacterium]